MTRLAEIQSHVRSMHELLDIVGAMRSLAGMRMQEAIHALPGIRHYTASIRSGIADSSLLMGEVMPARFGGQAPRALVAFMSEHGFVGGYNERLTDMVRQSLRPIDHLFVLGSRGMAHLTELGVALAWSRPLASRAASSSDVVQALSRELYLRIARGEIGEVDVVFSRYVQASQPVIERQKVLPPEPVSMAAEVRRQAPLHNLAPRVLQERLIAEYVFAVLMAAAVESIASENSARLAAMESAHDNVSKRLDNLRREAGLARQSEITAEILELVTAEAALSDGDSSRFQAN